MENKNKKILISSILLSTFIICLMASYAFFNYSGSTNTIKYTTGIIDVTLNSGSSNINVTNMFPMEYDDMLSLNLDNKLEFNIEGTNESNKDFYYEIKIINGDEPEENSDADLTNDLTRIDSKYINFDIYYHDDTLNKDYYYVMNGNLNDYMSDGIVVGKLSNNSSIDNDFIVRLWINDDVIIGNRSTAIYTTEEWTKLFASFKVQVDCDNTYREMKYSYTKKAQDTKTNVMQLYLFASPAWERGVYHNTYSDNRKYLEVTPTDSENEKISYFFPNNDFFRSKALKTTVINFDKVSTKELEELKTTLGTDNYYDHTNSDMVGKQTIGYFNQTNDDSDNPVYEYNLVSDGIIVFPEDSSNMFELVYNTSGGIGVWDAMYTSTATTKSYLNQIEYINFNNIYTGNTTDFGYMFMNHTALKELDLSNFDTHNAIRLSGMFCYASGVTELDVSNFDTSRATKIDWMFSGLTVTEIDGIEDLVINRVEIMNELFANSKKLINLDLSSWRINNVKHMSDLENTYAGVQTKYENSYYYFNAVQSNAYAKVYNASTGGGSTIRTSFGNIFAGCSNLESINISNWEFDNIKYISYLFAGLSNLTTLTMDNVDTSNVTDFKSMFYSCKMTSLPLDKIDTSSGTEFGYMFGSTAITTFDFDSLDLSKAISLNNFFDENKSLTTVEGSIDKCVVQNMRNLFLNCTSLVNVDLDIDTSNVTDFAGLFAGCTTLSTYDWTIDTSNGLFFTGMYNGCKKLLKIDLSEFDTSKGIKMGSMFWNCQYLNKNEAFDTTKINTNSATDLSGMFYGCYSFDQTCINGIQNYVVSNCTDFHQMFTMVGYWVSGTMTIDLSSWITSNVTSTSYMFQNTNFATINLSGWDLSKCTDYSYMFDQSRDLTSLNLSSWSINNTSTKTVSLNGMFRYCTGLTSLNLTSFDLSKPESSTTDPKFTTNDMFNGCTNLTTINVTTDKFINTYITSSTNMFNNCSSITGYVSTEVTADYISNYVTSA